MVVGWSLAPWIARPRLCVALWGVQVNQVLAYAADGIRTRQGLKCPGLSPDTKVPSGGSSWVGCRLGHACPLRSLDPHQESLEAPKGLVCLNDSSGLRVTAVSATSMVLPCSLRVPSASNV